MPIAVFFAGRGHDVYRVSSAKAADLRKFLHRHAKSNGIDAETLARMPIAGPRGLQQLELPGPDAAPLGRRVRACERLTRAASEHKVRIKALVRQLMPMTPLTGDLGKAGLAVLERHAGPRVLLAADLSGLTRLITAASNKQQGQERARQWQDAAAAAAGLYGDHPAVPYEELAAEVATEVRLLRAIQDELAAHAAAREQRYRKVDPGQLARIYHQQMTERGATHLKACCVVAGHLAERAWTVLNRGTPYAICDNIGSPVTAEQARQIITEKVRQSRRIDRPAAYARCLVLRWSQTMVQTKPA
jgi:hypothetical protein